MEQTLSPRSPWFEECSNEVQCVPRTTDIASRTFTVVANQIRLQLGGGITEAEFDTIRPGMWLLADDTARTSEVRRVIRKEKVEGSPDTFFVIVATAFTVAAASYALRLVDPRNYEPQIQVFAAADVDVNGVEGAITADHAHVFNFVSSQVAPAILHSAGAYTLSNTIGSSYPIP